MNPVARALITIGIILIISGLFWHFGGAGLGLGKLPGDIVIKKQNFRLYFPITTCILISAVLSLIFYLIRYFGSR